MAVISGEMTTRSGGGMDAVGRLVVSDAGMEIRDGR